MTEKTYRRLVQLGVELAREGYSVILDAKFDRQALRGMAIEQAQKCGIPLRILHCYAPEAVLRERLQRRMAAGTVEGGNLADIADATADLLAQQQAQWQDFSEGERSYLTVLDTSQDWQAQLQEITSERGNG
jgi:predicted kinase